MVGRVVRVNGVRRAWLCAALLMWVVGAAVGQAPAVPTDHYGPPVCTGMEAHVASTPSRAEAAREEQQRGAKDAHALLSAEPMENFGIARDRLADYADCVGNEGCYWADLDAQYKRAEAALAVELAKAKHGEKLAVVMDIDETTLSGYCEIKREDFGFIGPMFNGWVVTPEAAVAIPGALRLFNEAKAGGAAVYFITGRPGVPDYSLAHPGADQTAATARNLEAAGFHGWTGLQLRNGAENAMKTIEYKSGERQRIVDKGYRIVMSVGDQWSDLLGDPQAEVNVKLPNPFYFLP
jgi:HAD superfamily, subfamily IIIB (Acid phosphatase)